MKFMSVQLRHLFTSCYLNSCPDIRHTRFMDCKASGLTAGMRRLEVPMNRSLTVVIMAGTIFAGQQALADVSANQPALTKRQMITLMIDCMKKRMSADRAISYHEAAKTCKEDIKRDDYRRQTRW